MDKVTEPPSLDSEQSLSLSHSCDSKREGVKWQDRGVVVAAKQKAGESTRTESQAWPRRSYHRSWGLGAELGAAMGSIQLDTLVLRQPTSEVS